MVKQGTKKREACISFITKEMVQQKAYEIWEKEGNPDQLHNWLQAETFFKNQLKANILESIDS